MKQTPMNTPLAQWPDYWLIMETASLLDMTNYVLMSDSERKKLGLAASKEERIQFITDRQVADKLLADGAP